MTTTHMRTRPAATPVGPFAGQAEADAYRLLHDQGLAGWDETYGRAGNALLDRWVEAKLIRMTHPDGYVAVRTFAKYAKLGTTA